MTVLPADSDPRWTRLDSSMGSGPEGVLLLLPYLVGTAAAQVLISAVIGLFDPGRFLDNLEFMLPLLAGAAGLLSLYGLWRWLRQKRITRLLEPLDVRVLAAPAPSGPGEVWLRIRRRSKTRSAIANFTAEIACVLRRYGQDKSSAGDGSAGAPAIDETTIWSAEESASPAVSAVDCSSCVDLKFQMPGSVQLEAARNSVLACMEKSLSGFVEQARVEHWQVRVETVLESGFHAVDSFRLPRQVVPGVR